MSIRNTLRDFLQTIPNGYANKHCVVWLKKRKPELWLQIIEVTAYISSEHPSHGKQRLYHILNEITKIPVCPITGEILKWQGSRYFKYAGKSTHMNDPNQIEMRRKSSIEKFGYDNVAKVPEHKERAKATNQERYGVDWTGQSAEHKKANRKFWAENHDEMVEFLRNAHEEKTGYRYPMQNPEVAARQKQWWKNQDKKDLRAARVMKTNLERFGVPHHAQNPDWISKSQRYKRHQITLPSGIIISCQGYEGRAILKLIESGYNETDIVFNPKKMPKINYIFQDKTRRYFPDIYLPKENKIIEVKSKWTFESDYDKNIAKQNACLAMGFDFEFWILEHQ